MNSTKSMGARTHPCFTPVFVLSHLSAPSTVIHDSSNVPRTALTNCGATPILTSFLTNMSLGTVSYALAMSNMTVAASSNVWCSCTTCMIWFVTCFLPWKPACSIGRYLSAVSCSLPFRSLPIPCITGV
ncbi:hypothetical protein J8273_8722 [Carpediemonas membranifera]|uniref:Uncharacterized protein n=1 Tax=Carpediemonas membranifera TaxID=201153 RepID=A0A8J6AZ06_9EUKA|nr:hypothetical protein J8273_8722 [Carpediemonas membranifera]|eukprot:KAG9389432.1 hypothetical protein J8273_8722 [Carpediemonas membranifera]